ncbi:Rop guanine nucleotide exchange factor 12-like protein [Tanacetum coccineum]
MVCTYVYCQLVVMVPNNRLPVLIDLFSGGWLIEQTTKEGRFLERESERKRDKQLAYTLAYASSMPPVLSLPLYMACDDSDGWQLLLKNIAFATVIAAMAYYPKTTGKNKRGRDDEMPTWAISILWKANMYLDWATQIMLTRRRSDVSSNIPSLKKLDGMLMVLVGRFHDYGRLIVNDERGGGESVKAKARVEISEDAGCGLQKFCFMLL